MSFNVTDILKEHKKILLPGFGILFAVVVLTLASSGGIGLGSLDDTTVLDNISKNNSMKTYSSAPDFSIDKNLDYTAKINTSMGVITIDLFEKETPITVNNFVFLAKESYYDSVIFHRVIENFVIQGGDPTGTGSGGPGYQFADEITSRRFVPYVLAMANAGKSTNGSQFFITTKSSNTDYLTGNHTIFGQVTDGFTVVDKIEQVNTDSNNKPTTNVVINSIDISTR